MEFKVVLVRLLTKIYDQLIVVCHGGNYENKDLLLQVEDVLVYLHISKRTYYRLVQKGELKPRVIGGRHYYYKVDLTNALQQSRNRGRF